MFQTTSVQTGSRLGALGKSVVCSMAFAAAGQSDERLENPEIWRLFLDR